MIKASANVTPKAVFIICACVNVAEALNLDIHITAVMNGKHMVGSKHYIGNAIDLRSKNFPTLEAKQDFLKKVLARLGPGYEGFLEDGKQLNEHFHFEWDPK